MAVGGTGMFGKADTTKLLREELYEQVWAEPMTKLAQQYGLSDRGLSKICERMGIPVPGRGYWAKIQNGKVLPRTKLPAIKQWQQASVVLSKRGCILEESETFQTLSESIESELLPENRIQVASELTEPDPLVEKTAKSLGSAGIDDHGLAKPRAKRCLDLKIGKDSIDRAARIMDALVKALKEREIELRLEDEGEKCTRLIVDDESIGFSLEEKARREKYQPTPAEQKKLDEDSYYRYRLPDDKYFPSGDLSLKLDLGYWSKGLRGTWSDGKRQRVEDCLNKFIVTAYKAAALKKADRIERERQQREWEEEERQREILRKKIKLEENRVEKLTEQVKAWHEAQQLRAYVQAVRGAGFQSQRVITGGQSLDEWCAWAFDQAFRLDPTVTSPPSVLDHKKKYSWY